MIGKLSQIQIQKLYCVNGLQTDKMGAIMTKISYRLLNREGISHGACHDGATVRDVICERVEYQFGYYSRGLYKF